MTGLTLGSVSDTTADDPLRNSQTLNNETVFGVCKRSAGISSSSFDDCLDFSLSLNLFYISAQRSPYIGTSFEFVKNLLCIKVFKSSSLSCSFFTTFKVSTENGHGMLFIVINCRLWRRAFLHQLQGQRKSTSREVKAQPTPQWSPPVPRQPLPEWSPRHHVTMTSSDRRHWLLCQWRHLVRRLLTYPTRQRKQVYASRRWASFDCYLLAYKRPRLL